MKNWIIVLLMAVSGTASASCLDQMEDTLHTVTHPSYLAAAINPIYGATSFWIADEVKDIVSTNLDGYEDLIRKIRRNIRLGRSNHFEYSYLKNSLQSHEDDTVLGIEIGKSMTECIRPYLTFKGSPAQQDAVARLALSKIAKFRAAIQ